MSCEFTGCPEPRVKECKYCYQSHCSFHEKAKKHYCHKEPLESTDTKWENVKDNVEAIPKVENNEVTPGAEEEVIDDIKKLLEYTKILFKNTPELVKRRTQQFAKDVTKVYPIELIDLGEKPSVKSEFYNIKNYIEYYKKNTNSRKALEKFFKRIIKLCDD